MSDPTTTPPAAQLVTLANASYLKAKEFVLDLPWKVGRSVMWCLGHTETYLAIALGVILGAAASPVIRPHIGHYVPMIEAENVAPRTVNVDLSGVNRVLNELATRTANLERMAAATQSTALATQGTVAGIKDFTDHVPELIQGVGIFGAAAKAVEAPPAPPKPRPQPTVKKVQTAPVAPAAPVPAQAEPAALSLPDWLKSKF